MSSKADTLEHIGIVQNFMFKAIDNLKSRALSHDQSKLNSPEIEYFDKYTPMLEGLEYGSSEYIGILREMRPALDHHYANNSHHPEYYSNGIQGMNLLDLLEMLLDWKSAGLRHKLKPGDIMKSIEINQKRFNYSDELKQIFINTVKHLGIE